MEAGDTHVADPVDTVAVHHEMDGMVHSHCVYKPVWSRIGKQRGCTHPREGACQPIHAMNLQYVAVIKDSQIVGHTPPEICSQIMWHHIT